MSYKQRDEAISLWYGTTVTLSYLQDDSGKDKHCRSHKLLIQQCSDHDDGSFIPASSVEIHGSAALVKLRQLLASIETPTFP